MHLPVTLSVVLLTLNVGLMVAWIVILSGTFQYTALTVGTVLFALVLVGSTAYLVLSIKAVRLHARQVNFVDSVTHELKTPLAAAKLYLETLQLRPDMPERKRTECLEIMAAELNRLEDLITQLLEVGRLERLGTGVEVEDVDLAPLLRRAMTAAAAHHKQDPEAVFTADLPAVIVPARRMILETIFGNLIDNAVKYGGRDDRAAAGDGAGDREPRPGRHPHRGRRGRRAGGVPHEDFRSVLSRRKRTGADPPWDRSGAVHRPYARHAAPR